MLKKEELSFLDSFSFRRQMAVPTSGLANTWRIISIETQKNGCRRATGAQIWRFKTTK